MASLRDAGDRLPAAAVCISPWADLTCEGASHTTRRDCEILLDTEDLLRMAGRCLVGTDPTNPLASPVYGDLTGLPPLLIQVGSEEVLYDDARALEQAATKVGVPVTFEEWSEMFHVWHRGPTGAAARGRRRASSPRAIPWCRCSTPSPSSP